MRVSENSGESLNWHSLEPSEIYFSKMQLEYLSKLQETKLQGSLPGLTYDFVAVTGVRYSELSGRVIFYHGDRRMRSHMSNREATELLHMEEARILEKLVMEQAVTDYKIVLVPLTEFPKIKNAIETRDEELQKQIVKEMSKRYGLTSAEKLYERFPSFDTLATMEERGLTKMHLTEYDYLFIPVLDQTISKDAVEKVERKLALRTEKFRGSEQARLRYNLSEPIEKEKARKAFDELAAAHSAEELLREEASDGHYIFPEAAIISVPAEVVKLGTEDSEF